VAAVAADVCVMTKLYAGRHHLQHQSHYHVTFQVAESMSSLSDVSDELPPPKDDIDVDLISRVYGLGRKPTTIALTFRPPRKQRVTHKLPKLVTKTTKPSCRRPSNATSYGVSSHSDGSHVTSGRQNGGMTTSKSMHSLSKMNPEVNYRAKLTPDGGNETKTTSSERRHTVTSSSETVEHRTANGLISSDWKQTDSSAARSNSVSHYE